MGSVAWKLSSHFKFCVTYQTGLQAQNTHLSQLLVNAPNEKQQIMA